MNNYNILERMIAKFLSRFPIAKRVIKRIYQILNYFYYKKLNKFKTNYEILKISVKKEESFFGYYDKTPINKLNNYLIFHSADHSTKNTPQKNRPIKVVLFDFIKNEVKVEYPTNAYNWQQGAKLQWITENNFIFNDYDKQKDIYISKIVNSISGKIIKTIDYPVYDVYNNLALSLNFARLNVLRPDYGYRNRKIEIDFVDNDNDGIFFINLINNNSKLIISLQDIIKLHCKDNMKFAKHWFNHIMISPNGDKFMFLHRWLVGNKKYDALIVSGINGEHKKCLVDEEMVSHCCWYGNDKIISFMRDKQRGDKYYIIDINTGKREILGDRIIDKFGDGHPSVFNNKLLFDTYPNKARMKELYLFDLEKNDLFKLGEFFESFEYYGETRCDLHPRWSPDGKYLSIDSTHEGIRKLYLLDVSG